jgi:predicted GIY-YIG superfamily endonuclease
LSCEERGIYTKRYCFTIIDNIRFTFLPIIRKTVLYTGVTNNLEQRIIEHYLDKGNIKTSTGKYNCFYLVYYECTQYINNAIAERKKLKDGTERKRRIDKDVQFFMEISHHRGLGRMASNKS